MCGRCVVTVGGNIGVLCWNCFCCTGQELHNHMCVGVSRYAWVGEGERKIISQVLLKVPCLRCSGISLSDL